MAYLEVNTEDDRVDSSRENITKDDPDGSHRRSTCCCCREFFLKKRWVVIAFVFAMSCIAMSSYVVYRELFPPTKENEVLNAYGAFFQTDKEIEELEKSQNYKIAPITRNSSAKSCSFTCTNSSNLSIPGIVLGDEPAMDGTVGRVYGKPSSNTIYHGCCQSTIRYWSPVTLRGKDGKDCKNCHIVQFRNMKQYFRWEDCQKVQACSGCECRIRPGWQVALVWRPNTDHNKPERDYSLEDFQLTWLLNHKASCKCEN